MRGSIRRRGSTYTWYISVPDPVTGERRQRSKGGFRTKRECQEALSEALARQREGTFVRSSSRGLGAFLVDEWLLAVRPPRVRPSTWASYRMAVERHIVPALGGVLLQGLTPAHLTAFYRMLLDDGRRDGRGGLAPKSVRNIHGVLHAALRDAVRWGYLPRNIAGAADLPKGLTPEMHVWSPEQLRAFLDQVRGDPLYAGWLLLATTGMRRGEVAGLRWVDVDLDAGRVSPRRPRVVVNYEVVVSEPKTAKGRRSLALDPATVAALRQHRTRQLEQQLAVGPRWQDSGLVFTWPDGRPIHPHRFSKWFEQHTRVAGLPKIRLHDVRHSYATAALAAGVPAKVVSERLGHANIAITMDTYSHVLPGLDAQAAGAVARLILGDAGQAPVRPVDRPLTSGRRAADGGEEVKGEPAGRGLVRAGGFEPPRPKTPGPKLPTRCAGECSPDLYQADAQAGWRASVPSHTALFRCLAARPVSNLVSMEVPVPSGRGRHRRSGPPRPGTDRPAGHGKADASLYQTDPLLPKPDQLGCRPGPTDELAAQRALSLTVDGRGIPLPAVPTGTRMARADDLAASPQR
jgi:integrase